MRIGIFAGTFDPVHEGHIRFAEAAVQQGHLDKVVMVAEKNPYRKQPIAGWDHRQAMIERATEDMPEADHDYQFANQLAHQHTMQNMLTATKKYFTQAQEIWFLVGSDIFEHMSRWQDIAKEDEYGGFIVALRADHNEQWLQQKVQELHTMGFPVRLIIIGNNHPMVSSRVIRDKVREGFVPKSLPMSVFEYATVHQLYTE